MRKKLRSLFFCGWLAVLWLGLPPLARAQTPCSEPWAVWPGNQINLCPGDSTMLWAPWFPDATYLWSNGDTLNFTFVQGVPAVHTVTIMTPGCTSTSPPIVVSVGAGNTPAPTITAQGPTTLCPGQQVTLMASTAPPGHGYLWSNGSRLRWLNVRSAGRYFVRHLDLNNPGACAGFPSDTIEVSFVPPPTGTLQLSASGPTAFCLGGQVSIRAAGTVPPGQVIRWNTGDTGRVVTVRHAIGVQARLVNAANCQGPGSNTIQVFVDPRPDSVVLAVDDSLVSQHTLNNTTFQWFLDGLPIQGASGRSIRPLDYVTTGTGAFRLFLRRFNCVSWSETFVINSNRTAPVVRSLALSPNPVPAGQPVQLPLLTEPGLQLVLTNALGQVMRQQPWPTGNGALLPTAGLAPGLYLIRLDGGGQVWQGRLLVK